MVKTDKQYSWELVYKCKGGHKFFKDLASGRIAICDESGPTPDKTDDGVLWIDLTRPIIIGARCSIPLTDDKGGEYSTTGWATEAIGVAFKFGWAVKAGDEIFKVCPIEVRG